MDDPGFARFAGPLTIPVTRRRVLRGLGGGLAAALVGARARSTAAAIPPAQELLPYALGNPAGRILLPGEAGLTDYGLDFQLVGPPTVYFGSNDIPGWSSELKEPVDGFALGYTATLANKRSDGGSKRAVQVCVNHGFSSEGDAATAWSGLTAALASSGEIRSDAPIVVEVDLIEVIELNGQRTILATVESDQFDAVVFAARVGSDLVTVAMADFTGRKPTMKEAAHLAEVEAAKLTAVIDFDSGDLTAAFAAQWIPGFAFNHTGSLPFYSWPVILDRAPVVHADDTQATISRRRDAAPDVHFKSHVEGAFGDAGPAFANHFLYYNSETNYFSSGESARSFQAGTKARLEAGLPGISLTQLRETRTEHRYAYHLPTELGTLAGLSLHRLVLDGAFPIATVINILAVPFDAGTDAPTIDWFSQRLGTVIIVMSDKLELGLLDPRNCPATISVDPPEAD
jgi:hypothetical protein